MSTLLKKLTTPTGHSATSNPIKTKCNYANNYYGDQVCVAVNTTNNGEVNNLSNQLGAAQ